MRFGIDTTKLHGIARSVRRIHDEFNDEVKFDDDLNMIPVTFGAMKNVRDIISLDGSYSVLWQSPSYPLWIVIVRTAILKRGYDRIGIKINRIHDSFVDKLEVIDGNMMTKECNDEIEIISNDDHFNPRMIESYIGHESTRQEEGLALQLSRENTGVMIFFDGALNSPNNNEKRAQFLKDTINACNDNDNILVGISKDSGLKKINKITHDEIILNKFSSQHPGFTGFYLIEEGLETGIGTCFARLHPDATKWFRIDFMARTPMSIPEIIETVACYSQVNTLPGTPYPPLCAHEIAVMVRQLKSTIEEELMKSLLNEGFTMEFIVKGMTNVNGTSAWGTYHDHLDMFTKLRKKIEL